MNYIDILPIVYPLAKHARRHDGACLGAIGKKNTRDPVLVKSQRYRENSLFRICVERPVRFHNMICS